MLNKNQMKAVLHVDGPFLCVAGPGSGKTTVIMHRIRNLIEVEGVEPQKILVVTFTKAAADEMKKRYLALTGRDDPISFSTIHSFCFSVIRNELGLGAVNVLDEETKFGLIKKFIKDNTRVDPNDIEEKVKAALNEISSVKMKKIDLLESDYQSSCLKNTDFKKLFVHYESYKEDEGKIDYDDMLLICEGLFKNKYILSKWQNMFDFVMVDEFQDTDFVQSEIIYSLAESHKNIFVVGDDDQSIYKFRGAEPKIMLGFQEMFPRAKVCYLDINYRSEENIISSAKKLIENNKERFDKDIRGNKKEKGSVRSVVVNDGIYFQKQLVKEIKSEKITKSYTEKAVLCRTNSEISVIAGILSNEDIPFQCSENLKNIHSEFLYKDVISYLKIALGKESSDDLIGIANKPKRYLSKELCNETKCDLKKMADYIADNFDSKKRFMGFRNFYKYRDDLDKIRAIKNTKPEKFLQILFHNIGYLEYVSEYCDFVCIDEQKAEDIIDFMQDECKRFDNLADWYTYILRYDIKFAESAKEKSQNKDGVILSTMHRSKGLEWDQVFVTGLNKGNLPYERQGRKAEEEEERRLLYVAITRARKSCTLFSVDKTGRGDGLSIFCDELSEDRSENLKIAK